MISSHPIITIKMKNNNYLKAVCVDGSWNLIIESVWEFVGSGWFKLFDAKNPVNLFDLVVSLLNIEIKILPYKHSNQQTVEHFLPMPWEIVLFERYQDPL